MNNFEKWVLKKKSIWVNLLLILCTYFLWVIIYLIVYFKNKDYIKENKTTKKVNKANLSFHKISIKIRNNKHLYIGQFLKIEEIIIEDDNDDDFIDDVKYYFSAFDEGIVTYKIPEIYEEYCEKYRYGIVKSINDNTADILIICYDGYLQRYFISGKRQFKNGEAFIINNGNLIENNEIVGKITDTRYNPNINIILNGIDNDKLVVFIEK